MTRAGLLGVVAFFVWVAPGQAQNPAPSPPATTPTAACDSCRTLQQGLEALEKELLASEERLKNLDGESLKNSAEIEATLEKRQQLKEAGEFATAEAKMRLYYLEGALEEAVETQWLTHGRIQGESDKANKLREQIAALRNALATCNRSCTAAPSAPALTTGGAGTATTGASATATNAPKACEDCDAMKSRRELLQGQLSDIRERLDGIERAHKDVEGLKARAKGDQIRELDSQLNQVKAHRQQAVKAQSEMWKELRELNQKLKDCNKACKPRQTSQLFRSPFPYAGAGGVIAVIRLVDKDSPTVIAATPVTPQQPVNVTPPSNPTTSQPAPTRRPAALINVSGCVCVENSAILDALLQLCQRLRQIRTSGSGNSMTLTGDAPLPMFQGTFTESTGDFELRVTTTVGTTSTTVVIAGTVETSGSLHNLRVAFSGAGGRQTLYTLTTAVAQ